MSRDSREFVIRSLSEELYEFDTTLSHTTTIRNTVIEKLERTLEAIDAVNLSDPDVATIQLGAINTTLKALSDQEASSTRRVTAKLRHQESIRDDKTSDKVVELMRAMARQRVSGDVDSFPAIDFDEVANAMCRSLEETGDLIKDTELRFDPDDLS